MGSDILTEIISVRKRRVLEAQRTLPLEKLKAQVEQGTADRQVHRLATALSNDLRPNIIAEFKRRSPSKGVIRSDADPHALSSAYERGGAAAISVLTEEDFFAGSLDDLRSVREAVRLPILRKDFVFDEYQVWESGAAGAAAILLIVSVLTDEELRSLRRLAEDGLGIDALVEVHSATELQRALTAGAKIIGVNNRNLRSFEVSLDVSVDLAREAPAETILVSESGIATRDDLTRLRELGYRGFLIGESLMRAADPEQTLRSLLG
ncbi:MAG TPA: indole-3-glycerol phosphate synthase TrpC [Pyrinomonadaceae bacterium]|nr:indole-3-glycerol phosphate synthase TrpC [Pyrinomonadaceae bacterium]